MGLSKTHSWWDYRRPFHGELVIKAVRGELVEPRSWRIVEARDGRFLMRKAWFDRLTTNGVFDSHTTNGSIHA
jgi:hypothetical protein